MAGKDIQRIRAQSALEVVRQHPVLALFAASHLRWWVSSGGSPERAGPSPRPWR
jgi:hypothetical protein